MPRPFNTSQPLGKIMEHRQLRVKDVEAMSGISYRTISDYLAGRRDITDDHAVLLSEALSVPAGWLDPRVSSPPTKGVLQR